LVALFLRQRVNQRPAAAAANAARKPVWLTRAMSLCRRPYWTIEALRNIISFRPAVLSPVNVSRSDHVRKGQPFATLKTTDLNDALWLPWQKSSRPRLP